MRARCVVQSDPYVDLLEFNLEMLVACFLYIKIAIITVSLSLSMISCPGVQFWFIHFQLKLLLVCFGGVLSAASWLRYLQMG